MAQRVVELVIGRLITDEELRNRFLVAPEETLLDVSQRGFDLTPIEIAALINTDRSLWERGAELLDPRLQKASLLTHSASQKASSNHA